MGYLSLATMLVQTNDGIVLGNSLPLFDEDGNPRSFTMDLISYDAGTEPPIFVTQRTTSWQRMFRDHHLKAVNVHQLQIPLCRTLASPVLPMWELRLVGQSLPQP
jgi:hypothetical protein